METAGARTTGIMKRKLSFAPPSSMEHTGQYFKEKMSWYSCRLYLDPCIPEHLERGPHISLELVLHPSEAQQLHLPLQAFHNCSYFQCPVMDAQFGLTVSALRTEGIGHRYVRASCV